MLDDKSLLVGVKVLAESDPHLKKVVDHYGPPPLWDRDPGFPSLLKIILEQQVSLASAQATYDKLLAKANPLTPASFLLLSDEELKSVGFSRQKTRYVRILAEAIFSGFLDLDELKHFDDEVVMNSLTSLTGIGPWTAGIYLLMVLRRPDVWPRGDLALLSALRDVKELECVPSNDEATKIAHNWRPLRSVAVRILWHHYLSERGRS
jgi:DNA-3-methyladenine glycosylase II